MLLHLEIIVDRLKEEFKVPVTVGAPSVSFRETITTPFECNYRFVKQTGGKGQFAHTVIRFEPNPGGGFEFVDITKGGVIPKEYIPSVQKGLAAAMNKGPFAGYPVVDVKCVLVDGSSHPVDSSDMAFQLCAQMCFKQAFMKASPVLLEPVMKVEINTPDDYIGNVTGDVNKRRGRIEAMRRFRKGSQKLDAFVPLMEMFGYATALRNLTSGRANYSTSFEGLVLKTFITSETLVSDHIVDRFVEQLPEKEPTQEKVDHLRHEYELETMLELIDFEELYRHFGRLTKVIYGNSNLFEDALIKDLSKRHNRVYEELCGVSHKFEAQIQMLHEEQPSCEQNPALQERLIKGVAYFNEHLKSIAVGLLDLPYKTDNQAVNEQITEALKQLKEDLFLKGCCLEACKDGFSVKDYLKTKSVKVIEEEKRTNKKVEIKFDASKGGSLYSRLLSWREARSEADEVPASNIAPIKTLKAIAEAKPVTLSRLQAIDGMGPKRIKNYGAEILDIVLRCTGQNPETADMGSLPEKPEKKLKGDSNRITKEMFDKGMTVEAIAKERGFSINTILGHLVIFVEQGTLEASKFVAEEKYNEILDYFESTFDPSLPAAKDVLGEDYEYGEIKAVLAELNREHFFEQQPDNED